MLVFCVQLAKTLAQGKVKDMKIQKDQFTLAFAVNSTCTYKPKL